jgi:hypothetical protein
MGADYIPEKDIKAACWMKRFARTLVEQPDAYRTTPEDAAEIDALVTVFRTANARCWPSAIRNRVRVVTKNQARKSAEQMIRPASQRIRTDPRIADVLKLQIGLKPKGKRRRQIPAPESVPLLILNSATSGVMTIKVLDSTSGRRGKPKEAQALELYERVRPRDVINALRQKTPVADNSSNTVDPLSNNGTGRWRFIGVYTRTPIQVYPATNHTGDEVSYVARWVTARGEPANFGEAATIYASHGSVRNVSALARRDHRAVA